MIPEHRLKDPRTLIRLGAVCLLFFFALPLVPRIFDLTTDFWAGVIDGARGVFFGAGVTLYLLAARLIGRQRGCGAA
jgi:hypothetical protein